MITLRHAVHCVLVGAAFWMAISPVQADSDEQTATAQAAMDAATQGDVILLNFAATWCGPCRQMAPIIGEITAAGWVVRHVDADQEPNLVKRFGVTGVPCYVLLVHGEEVGRINGATTRNDLENLLKKSRKPLGLADNPSTPGRMDVPQAPPVPGIPLPVVPAGPLLTEPKELSQNLPHAVIQSSDLPEPLSVSPSNAIKNVSHEASAQILSEEKRQRLERKLLQATARLRVDDPQGMSGGTGTVIDCRQGEALILTCGHIFRDSDGKGKVKVDLFSPNAPRGVAGQVVAYDLTRDLALVSIFTDQPIEAVSVGGPEERTKAGESVVTVGCNGGDDPTIHYSKVNGVDKYLGPANVQVAGQPVEGRSGGGLFSLDGTLIGVCNAADPADNEGLFAALPAIHEHLDEAGLAFVYRSVYPSGGLPQGATDPSSVIPNMPDEMPEVAFDRRDRANAVPTASSGMDHAVSQQGAMHQHSGASLSDGEQTLLDHVRQHKGKAEVICIVRPHGSPQGASEVFVLQDASEAFVEHLSRTHLGRDSPADPETLLESSSLEK